MLEGIALRLPHETKTPLESSMFHKGATTRYPGHIASNWRLLTASAIGESQAIVSTPLFFSLFRALSAAELEEHLPVVIATHHFAACNEPCGAKM